MKYKSCTLTIFCLRDNLHRDTAPVPFSNFSYREKYTAVYQTSTATAPAPNKIRTWTAKSTPCSPHPSTGTLTLETSCYHDRRRATQPPFIAGPLAARQIGPKCSLYLDFRRARKSFAARPCNRPTAKHMLFCLPGLRQLDDLIMTRQSLPLTGTQPSGQLHHNMKTIEHLPVLHY